MKKNDQIFNTFDQLGPSEEEKEQVLQTVLTNPAKKPKSRRAILTRRFALSFSALAVATACFFTFVGSPIQLIVGRDGGIVSDGQRISGRRIDRTVVQTELEGAETLPAVGNRATLLRLLKDRGAIYEESLAERFGFKNSRGVDLELSEMTNDAAMPAPQSAPEAPGGGADDGTLYSNLSGDPDIFSETNEQVEGVSEGDVVKTDGKYLYSLRDNILRIIAVDKGDMEVVGTISFTDAWGAEFYLLGDTIAVISQKQIYDPPAASARIEPYYWDYWNYRNVTVLNVYDITDRTDPKEARRVEMDGWNVSSRVVGRTVYLVTNKHVHAPAGRADTSVIMPHCFDTLDGREEARVLDYDDIYYIPGTLDASYLMIGAVDLDKSDPFEPQAYLGAGSTLYMSRNAIYVAQQRWVYEEIDGTGGDAVDRWAGGWWGGSKCYTDILRFAVSGTEIAYTGTAEAEGWMINQYSMDEHDGFFRVATTQWGIGTAVTVFDGKMEQTGRTPWLEPNEQMQSMRFMGNMGYVVTFENTDPLFTIDLSNPYDPRVLGELKIPGFSQYLHPVGPGLLMGIGRDTDEIYDDFGNVVGFTDTGLKISLFDVSNPRDPKEVNVLRLGNGWAEVGHNPRALMCDPARGLYGFTMDRWGYTDENRWDSYWNSFSAVLVKVENGKLSLEKEIDAGRDFYYGWGSRLAFIGNTLYFIHGQGVWAYDYTTYEQIGGLTWEIKPDHWR
jgi:uncharacterized secreted protein with C-terminal beta-propeller domain